MSACNNPDLRRDPRIKLHRDRRSNRDAYWISIDGQPCCGAMSYAAVMKLLAPQTKVVRSYVRTPPAERVPVYRVRPVHTPLAFGTR